MSELLALVTLDCEHKTRIHYILPLAVPRGLEAWFPEATYQLREFSKSLAGALDHIQVDAAERFSLSAAIGSRRIIVTYAKSYEIEERARIEGLLLELCGPACRFHLRGRQEPEAARSLKPVGSDPSDRSLEGAPSPELSGPEREGH